MNRPMSSLVPRSQKSAGIRDPDSGVWAADRRSLGGGATKGPSTSLNFRNPETSNSLTAAKGRATLVAPALISPRFPHSHWSAVELNISQSNNRIGTTWWTLLQLTSTCGAPKYPLVRNSRNLTRCFRAFVPVERVLGNSTMNRAR